MAVKLFDFSKHKPKLLLETFSMRFACDAVAGPYLLKDAPGEVLVEPFLKASGDGKGSCSALISTEDDEVLVSKFFHSLMPHHQHDFSCQDNYLKWSVSEQHASWLTRNFVVYEPDGRTRKDRLINLSLGGARELWNQPTKMFSVTDGGRKARAHNGKGPNFQLLIPITNKDVPHWLLALCILNSRSRPDEDRYITNYSDAQSRYWYSVRELDGVEYIAIQQSIHTHLNYWNQGEEVTTITRMLREAKRLENFEVESLLALKRDVMNGTKLDSIDSYADGGFPIFEVFKSLNVKEPAVPIGRDDEVNAPYPNPWDARPVPRPARGYRIANGPALR